ncbi:GAP family protein [Agromyces sp. NPDC058484]|uniref:GAP family protein n=1 Tax=Agromyces sp. NPDC058484 TaxID=3346524 RepID=UPI00364FFBE9
MLQAIGHILPIALAVALSSVPIMATILILLSPRRAQSAIPFLIGWVLGIVSVVSLCTLAAQAIPTSRSSRQPDTVIGIGEIVVGSALIVIGIVAWRRARANPSADMPKWLSAVGSLRPWASFGVAFALNVRPKGLLLAIAAGLALRGDDLSFGQSVVAILVYTIIGSSTVAVPIIVSLAAPERMEPRLLSAKDWITRNNGAITSLILALIGVVIIGTGLGRL